jgi:hypothetical protein
VSLHPTAAAKSEAAELIQALWGTATSATAMLETLTSANANKRACVSQLDQQFRLFAAWCARRTNQLLSDPRSRHSVRSAELFAISAISASELQAANAGASDVVREIADRYKEPSLQESFQATNRWSHFHDSSVHPVDSGLALGCVLLHAAYTASHASAHRIGTTGGIRAAIKCAEASRKALYYQLLSEGVPTALFTDRLEEEGRHQAEALRTFIGHPFDEITMPPMAIPLRF